MREITSAWRVLPQGEQAPKITFANTTIVGVDGVSTEAFIFHPAKGEKARRDDSRRNAQTVYHLWPAGPVYKVNIV